MKLRLGLTNNLDLFLRCRVVEAAVSNTFITWLNFLYIRLGAPQIWPHRREGDIGEQAKKGSGKITPTNYNHRSH